MWPDHRYGSSFTCGAVFLRFFRKIVHEQKTMNAQLLIGSWRIDFVQAPLRFFLRHRLHLAKHLR
jgi:hypothetical protein